MPHIIAKVMDKYEKHAVIGCRTNLDTFHDDMLQIAIKKTERDCTINDPNVFFARVIFFKGLMQCHKGDKENAVATFDILGQYYPHSEKIELQRWVAQAMLIKAIVLYRLCRTNKAIATFNRVIENYYETKDMKLQKIVVKAMLNKGIALNNLGMPNEAVVTFDDVLRKWGSRHSFKDRKLIKKTRRHKCIALYR